MTDARNGTTTYTYDDADRLVTTVTPTPGGGLSAQTTTTYFDPMGRAWKTVLPDSTCVTNEFNLTGTRKKTYGSRQYPVEFTYDGQGRKLTMKTWTNFVANSGAAVTTWTLDSQRGWVSTKRDATNLGCDYTYKPSGRLLTRTWARGNPRISTTYSYNTAGELSGVDYSDSTPDISYTYDRRGHQATCVQNGMTTTRYFNAAGVQIGESYSGGTLGGLSITNLYDDLLRRTNIMAKNAGTTLSTAGYAYDNASRLNAVSDNTYSASYTYVDNSPLIGQIDFKQNSTVCQRSLKLTHLGSK